MLEVSGGGGDWHTRGYKGGREAKEFFFVVSVKLKWVGSKLFFSPLVGGGGVLFAGSPPRVPVVLEGLKRCTDPGKSTL